jgi:hypothetical protein
VSDAIQRSDWRPRLTRQVVLRLAQEQSVVVVGGPGMGKTALIRYARQEAPGLEAFDDLSADGIIDCLSTGEAALMTAKVEHYSVLKRSRGRAMWVPLSNLVPHGIRTALPEQPTLWEETAGHPLCAAHLLSGAHEDGDLMDRYRDLLVTHPEHKAVFDALILLPENLSSAQRYTALLNTFGADLKGHLDWLVCAGAITRMIAGSQPGMTVVPYLSRRGFESKL